MEKAFILDTDGTTALHTEEERGHYEYSKVKYDRPNQPVIDLALLLHRNYVPIVVTGRMDIDECRADTVSWYRQYFPEYFTNEMRLFMRNAKLLDGKPDYRKDDIVKEEIYNTYIKDRFDVVYAVDDRPRVLRMWQTKGITTLAVGTPWIEF